MPHGRQEELAKEYASSWPSSRNIYAGVAGYFGKPEQKGATSESSGAPPPAATGSMCWAAVQAFTVFVHPKDPETVFAGNQRRRVAQHRPRRHLPPDRLPRRQDGKSGRFLVDPPRSQPHLRRRLADRRLSQRRRRRERGGKLADAGDVDTHCKGPLRLRVMRPGAEPQEDPTRSMPPSKSTASCAASTAARPGSDCSAGC